MSASLTPTSITGSGTSTLNVTTTTKARGTYTLTVKGVSGGITKSVNVTLNVQ